MSNHNSTAPMDHTKQFRESNSAMPMIDVYGASGTFSDKHKLAQNLAKAVMKWENVPPIDLFRTRLHLFTICRLRQSRMQPALTAKAEEECEYGFSRDQGC